MIIEEVICAVIFVDSSEEASVKKLLFQVRKDAARMAQKLILPSPVHPICEEVVNYRLRKGTHKFLPCHFSPSMRSLCSEGMCLV
jgi:hypothetical protein